MKKLDLKNQSIVMNLIDYSFKEKKQIGYYMPKELITLCEENKIKPVNVIKYAVVKFLSEMTEEELEKIKYMRL